MPVGVKVRPTTYKNWMPHSRRITQLRICHKTNMSYAYPSLLHDCNILGKILVMVIRSTSLGGVHQVESLKYTGIFSGTIFSWFHHAFGSSTEYFPVCNHKVGVALVRSWVITRVAQSLQLYLNIRPLVHSPESSVLGFHQWRYCIYLNNCVSPMIVNTRLEYKVRCVSIVTTLALSGNNYSSSVGRRYSKGSVTPDLRSEGWDEKPRL